MGFKLVRLELGRTDKYPEGTPAKGFELVIPVDERGHLDEKTWHENQAACTVTRFGLGDFDRDGNLILTPKRQWAISYEPGEADDTPIFHLETHHIQEGDYLSITDEDGVTLPFRVASVKDLS